MFATIRQTDFILITLSFDETFCFIQLNDSVSQPNGMIHHVFLEKKKLEITDTRKLKFD